MSISESRSELARGTSQQTSMSPAVTSPITEVPSVPTERGAGPSTAVEPSPPAADGAGPSAAAPQPALRAAPPAPERQRDAATADHGWHALVAQGRYREAMAAVEREGFERVLAGASASDLIQLAEAARHSGEFRRAREALLRARRLGRTAGRPSCSGKLAADHLGAPREAITWLQTYPRARAHGGLESRRSAGSSSCASAWGRRGRPADAALYLRRYPGGAYTSSRRCGRAVKARALAAAAFALALGARPSLAEPARERRPAGRGGSGHRELSTSSSRSESSWRSSTAPSEASCSALARARSARAALRVVKGGVGGVGGVDGVDVRSGAPSRSGIRSRPAWSGWRRSRVSRGEAAGLALRAVELLRGRLLDVPSPPSAQPAASTPSAAVAPVAPPSPPQAHAPGSAHAPGASRTSGASAAPARRASIGLHVGPSIVLQPGSAISPEGAAMGGARWGLTDRLDGDILAIISSSLRASTSTGRARVSTSWSVPASMSLLDPQLPIVMRVGAGAGAGFLGYYGQGATGDARGRDGTAPYALPFIRWDIGWHIHRFDPARSVLCGARRPPPRARLAGRSDVPFGRPLLAFSLLLRPGSSDTASWRSPHQAVDAACPREATVRRNLSLLPRCGLFWISHHDVPDRARALRRARLATRDHPACLPRVQRQPHRGAGAGRRGRRSWPRWGDGGGTADCVPLWWRAPAIVSICPRATPIAAPAAWRARAARFCGAAAAPAATAIRCAAACARRSTQIHRTVETARTAAERPVLPARGSVGRLPASHGAVRRRVRGSGVQRGERRAVREKTSRAPTGSAAASRRWSRAAKPAWTCSPTSEHCGDCDVQCADEASCVDGVCR